MFLFRSITTGLLGACVALLVRLEPPARPAIVVTAAAPTLIAAGPAASIVDVAPGLVDVASLVQLGPDEHVIAVADRPVVNDLAAGAAIAALPRGAGRYIDLTVASADATRRVLVLLH